MGRATRAYGVAAPISVCPDWERGGIPSLLQAELSHGREVLVLNTAYNDVRVAYSAWLGSFLHVERVDATGATIRVSRALPAGAPRGAL